MWKLLQRGLDNWRAARHYRQVLKGMYGCWKLVARPHPWELWIKKTACGYMEAARLADTRCIGCVSQRNPVSTFDQLNKLHATGDAAGELK